MFENDREFLERIAVEDPTMVKQLPILDQRTLKTGTQRVPVFKVSLAAARRILKISIVWTRFAGPICPFSIFKGLR